MGKVVLIQKSRKEYKCSKCGQVIPKGSSYWKGELNFHPSIYRCTDCGLKGYEVTTSSYTLQVGAIVEEWTDTYGISDGCWDEIVQALEEVRDELEGNLENMPEQLQDSETGELLQQRIEAIEDAISELEGADMSTFVDSAFSNLSVDQQTDEFREFLDTTDAWWEKLIFDVDDQWGEVADDFMNNIREEIEAFVNDALSSLEY
jgi:DNA-directed RNA polymerase subunit RPC12/RpoP